MELVQVYTATITRVNRLTNYSSFLPHCRAVQSFPRCKYGEFFSFIPHIKQESRGINFLQILKWNGVCTNVNNIILQRRWHTAGNGEWETSGRDAFVVHIITRCARCSFRWFVRHFIGSLVGETLNLWNRRRCLHQTPNKADSREGGNWFPDCTSGQVFGP